MGFTSGFVSSRNLSDIFDQLVSSFLTFNEAELSDVVAVIRRVDDVGVFQLPGLHEHVVELRHTDGQANMRHSFL